MQPDGLKPPPPGDWQRTALLGIETKYRALFEQFPEAVFLTIPNGTILAANPAACAMFGMTEEEIVRGGRDALIDEEDPRHAATWAERERTGRFTHREATFVRKNGEKFPGEMSSVVLPGRELGAFVVVRDISGRKRGEKAVRQMAEKLRASEARARTIASNIRDHLVVLECIRSPAGEIADWRYIDANEAGLGLVRMQREQLIGKTMRQVIPERYSSIHERMVRVLETGKTETYESAYAGIVFIVTLFRVDENTIGSAGIDITERKRAEEALRDVNARLVESDLRKSEFLAVLSHELRNPLAPIRNSVYVLERTTPGGEQARHAVQVIDRQAQHMARLIEDLLDVTRISRGKINLQRERVDLDVLAQGTAEDHKGVFAKNGIDFEVRRAGQPLWVDGDPTRLAQIIGNLLQNAAKFTARGGQVVLSVEADVRGNAVVRVRDTGAGMSPETLHRIFEPFVQAEQTLERTCGGLGLGLALVKGLVEIHGGEVTARSEGEGKGSELIVSLPLQTPAKPKLSVVPPPQRGPKSRRVLVVEDNEDAAESLREVLELDDHEVALAHSGPEGVEAARRFKPDVILCDIGLPGMDGFGVARALRADPDARLRSTFLVALSGYALPEDVAKSKEAGFDHHMAKPPSLDALEKLLAEAPAQALRPAR